MYGMQIASPWVFVTPQPCRYLERRYVEDFFRDGSLRLSSFAQFTQHDDEQRRDETEGITSYAERSNEGELEGVYARVQMGINAYVLCTSSYYSESLARLFDRDSRFRINSTTDFAAVVSRHVPGFAKGSEGLCVYEENPGISRDSESGLSLGAEEHDGQGTYDAFALQQLRERIQQGTGLVCAST